VSAGRTSHLVLRGNVFAGFGGGVVDGVAPARRTELLADNIVSADRGRGPARIPAAEGR
jgi:hypothetical protein